MRGTRVAVGLVAALAALTPSVVGGQACDGREARALELGKRSEAAGKLEDAVILYRHALQVCAESAARGELQRLGRSMAARAEAAGRLYDTAPLLRGVPDEPCSRYNAQVGEGMKSEAAFGRLPGACDLGGRTTLNERASAFAWLEETGNHAEADGVMVKLARSRPHDLATFRQVLGHFDARTRQGSRPPTAPEHRRALEALAADNGQRHLRAEEQAAAALAQPSLFDEASRRSLAELARAEEWLRHVPDGRRLVAARAEQRGDTLARGETVRLLGEALAYYRMAGAETKIAQVQGRAERLGDAAARSGDHTAARRFFELAGNAARAEEMERRIGQQESDMRRTDAARQKFKKEQDALEKELGIK